MTSKFGIVDFHYLFIICAAMPMMMKSKKENSLNDKKPPNGKNISRRGAELAE
jgi:hypothetical protein